jgi:hypothetical protein
VLPCNEAVKQPDQSMSNTPDTTADYKALTLQREFLRKEFSDLYALRNEMLTYSAPYLTALYLDTLGKRHYSKFCLGVELSMIKQRIDMIQGFINRNESPDLTSIDLEIKKRFAEYQQKMDEEARELEKAKAYLKEKFLPEDIVKKLKEVYRLIVKRLHPDLNPDLTARENDLFVQAQAAYDLCDLDSLNQILLSLNLEAKAPALNTDLKSLVEKLADNVNKLKEQIEKLEKEFPFNWRDKLADTEWLETEQQVLDKQIAELTHEKEKLSEYMLLLQLWKPELLN